MNSAFDWLRKPLKASLILLPILTSACGSAQPAPLVEIKTVDSSCKVFRQITWSVEDSIETSSQVRRHNRKHAELCKQAEKKAAEQK